VRKTGRTGGASLLKRGEERKGRQKKQRTYRPGSETRQKSGTVIERERKTKGASGGRARSIRRGWVYIQVRRTTTRLPAGGGRRHAGNGRGPPSGVTKDENNMLKYLKEGVRGVWLYKARGFRGMVA